MEQIYGICRDGAYCTRIHWCTHTESDPTFWVCNLIGDDIQRNGGTWGANTLGPATVVLDFFGETQTISKIRFYRNVGADISVIEELAKYIDLYVSTTDEPAGLRRKENYINEVPWAFVKRITTEKAEGWMEVILDTPVAAKYIRMDLVENHGTPIDWVEISKVRFYGKN